MKHRSDQKNENIAKQIVEAFGGLSRTARALKHNNCSTIYSWVKSGRIPYWRFSEIEEAAKKNAVQLPTAFRKEDR